MADKQLLDFFARAIAPLKRRVMLSIARAVVKGIDDTTKMQLMQLSLLAGETHSKVERFQNYGFTSVPFEGAEACVVFPHGNREHGIIIAVDDRRYRMKAMEKGEVALYTDEGDYVHLKRNKEILVNCGNKLTANVLNEIIWNTKKVTINAEDDFIVNTKRSTTTASVKVQNTSPLVEDSGNHTTDGNVLAGGTVTGTTNVITPAGGGISLTEIQTDYNVHTHNYTDDGNPAVTSGPNNAV